MAQKNNQDDGIVYSTEHGRMCSGCAKPSASCTCSKSWSSKSARTVSGKTPHLDYQQKNVAHSDTKHTSQPSGDGIVRIRLEKKGRGGKEVTVISGIRRDDAALAELAGHLKKRCGTGGTVKNGTIEIQGDRRGVVTELLGILGYTVR